MANAAITECQAHRDPQVDLDEKDQRAPMALQEKSDLFRDQQDPQADQVRQVQLVRRDRLARMQARLTDRPARQVTQDDPAQAADQARRVRKAHRDRLASPARALTAPNRACRPAIRRKIWPLPMATEWLHIAFNSSHTQASLILTHVMSNNR